MFARRKFPWFVVQYANALIICSTVIGRNAVLVFFPLIHSLSCVRRTFRLHYQCLWMMWKGHHDLSRSSPLHRCTSRSSADSLHTRVYSLLMCFLCDVDGIGCAPSFDAEFVCYCLCFQFRLLDIFGFYFVSSSAFLVSASHDLLFVLYEWTLLKTMGIFLYVNDGILFFISKIRWLNSFRRSKHSAII